MVNINESNFPTVESRLEKFYSFLDHACHYLKRNVELDAKANNIIAVRERFDFEIDPLGINPQKEWFLTHNIVTNDGDIFYAERAVNASLTVDFLSANNRCELQNPAVADTPAKTDVYSNVTTPITASRKAITATYPKVSDNDTDNLGGDVNIASWDYSWLTTDFNTESANNIFGGCIHNAAGSPIAGSKLLTHYSFPASFEKLSTDKLKIFHNHELTGV